MATSNRTYTFEETLPSGEAHRHTWTSGVSADKSAEWFEQRRELIDASGRKVFFLERSARNASGSGWIELSSESTYLVNGSLHTDKTAQKSLKNATGDEELEKSFQRTGSGQAESWAGKWCTVAPTTPLEPGRPRLSHQSEGEKYDGNGGCVKSTYELAESSEGHKWGEKWEEHFDPNGQSVKKQGETWREDKYGERCSKPWGGHNGSGWVDTHARGN